MAYANLTDAQERALVQALNTQFMGMDQNCLLNFADVLAGVFNGADTTLTTSVTNLNAWATALATKLNADAGVTDTNYDTNPQA